MPRPPLSDDQVAEFRARLVEAALRLYAAGGDGAVSLRGLAHALGCSAAAPYRYFASKRDILAAVRAAGFDRLAHAQGSLLDERLGAAEQLRRLARGYLEFAQREPLAFRLMLERLGPHSRATEEEHRAETRAWNILYGAVRRAAEEGVLGGDPDTRAHALRASLHGIASLDLSGRLHPGPAASVLVDEMMDVLLRGSRPGADAARRPPRAARLARGAKGARAAEWRVW